MWRGDGNREGRGEGEVVKLSFNFLKHRQSWVIQDSIFILYNNSAVIFVSLLALYLLKTYRACLVI